MPKSKSEIVDYLASVGNVSKKQAQVVLEGLVRLCYREAHNGITIPGLCKIEIVQREARMGRNPRTGEPLQIPARKALKIRPVKKAKEMVGRVPAAPKESEEPVAASVVPSPDEQARVDEPIFITFRCTACGAEIEASTDMAEMSAVCPGCGAAIKVPSTAAINEFAGLESPESMEPAAPAEGAGDEDWKKGSTIRIELPGGEDVAAPPVRRTVYIKRRK